MYHFLYVVTQKSQPHMMQCIKLNFELVSIIFVTQSSAQDFSPSSESAKIVKMRKN